MNESKNYGPRELLQRELERRSAKNPRYSLRAFASSLGLSHTVLSLAIAGKRPLSKNACSKLAESLGFSSEQTKQLMKNRVPRISGASASAKILPAPEVLDLDRFAVISDWYYFAILSLLEVPNAQFEPRWIARRLGISPVQARIAVERLKRLEIVVEKDGRWRQASASLIIDNAKSTAATRKFQSQLIQRSLESLENDPLARRDHTAITFAMDPAMIPYAKQQIQAFRRSLCADLEKAGNPKEVYTVAVQLFPMSKELT